VNRVRKALLVLPDRKATLVLSACLALLVRRVIKGQQASQVVPAQTGRRETMVLLVRVDPSDLPALLDRKAFREYRDQHARWDSTSSS
jgi:hypothetical protein